MEKTQAKIREIIYQIIGELAIYMPLFFLSFCIGTGIETLTSILLYICFKSYLGFKESFHYPKSYTSGKLCFVTTYSIFGLIPILIRGINTTIPFMEKQPVLYILISALISFISARLYYYFKNLENGFKRKLLSQKELFIEYLKDNSVIEKYHEVFYQNIILKRRISDIVYDESMKSLLLDEQQVRNYKTKIKNILSTYKER